jgi:hypothetical protein
MTAIQMPVVVCRELIPRDETKRMRFGQFCAVWHSRHGATAAKEHAEPIIEFPEVSVPHDKSAMMVLGICFSLTRRFTRNHKVEARAFCVLLKAFTHGAVVVF